MGVAKDETGPSADTACRCSELEDLVLFVWAGSPLKAELTVAGITSALEFELGGEEAEVDFILLSTAVIFVVRKFLNKFSSSGLTNGTETLLWSSPYRVMTFCEKRISAL